MGTEQTEMNCAENSNWRNKRREGRRRTCSLISLACVVSCGAGSAGSQSPAEKQAHDEAVAADISCRAGNPDGCRALAWAWRNGTGVPKNEVLAGQFEQRAAQLEAQARAAATPSQQQPDAEVSRAAATAKDAERVRAAEVEWRKKPVRPFDKIVTNFRATLTAFGIDTAPYNFVAVSYIKVDHFEATAYADSVEQSCLFSRMLQRDFKTAINRFDKWASTEQLPFGDEPTNEVIEEQYKLAMRWLSTLAYSERTSCR